MNLGWRSHCTISRNQRHVITMAISEAASPFQGFSISGRLSIKTDSDRAGPIWNPKDQFWGTWSRRLALALSQAFFCARREVPLGSKNWKICKNIFTFTISTFSMQRELWEIFSYQKSQFSWIWPRGSRKEWNLGRSTVCQMSLIFGIRQIYMLSQCV